MIDIEKQVTYWERSAIEDWKVAEQLVRTRKTRHGLFFVHLALEKALKAHVCRHTQALAPRIHNLVRLAELSGLRLSDNQLDTLADINAFNIEGRYPDVFAPLPSYTEAREYLHRAEKVYQWLTKLL